jgi:hypothetical protein
MPTAFERGGFLLTRSRMSSCMWIVEDDAMLLSSLSDCFRDEQALYEISCCKFDAVVTDIRLGGKFPGGCRGRLPRKVARDSSCLIPRDTAGMLRPVED